MLRICVIIEEKLYQYSLPEGAREAVYMPLSSWQPAQVTGGDLLLPQGWFRQEGCPADRIPLRQEGNHLLTSGERSALMMVRIVPEDGLRTERVRVTERFTVGRAHSNQICCRDGYLSSYHGVFSFDRDGLLHYEDTSTNGTFIGGELLRGGERTLQTGDVLDFPPLMQATVNGAALHIRYPIDHAQVALEKLPAPAPGMLHALVCLRETGALRHIQLPESGCTGAELRAAVMHCLTAEDKSLLPPGPALRIAGESALIAPGDAVQLREGIVVVLG